MSENRHTPGPWEVRTREQMVASGRWQPEDLPAASPLYVIGDDAVDLTLVAGLPADPDDTGPDAEMLANAALMATAPDLLAALERAEAMLVAQEDELLNFGVSVPDGEPKAEPAILAVRAAIAKAKGGVS